MEISAKITNQILRVTQRHSVVSKSRGIYSLKVEYDKEWENITERVVIFKRLVDGLILAIKDSTGEVAVPWEVTDKISQVEIGVIGYNDNHEKIISTTAISGGNIILIAQATPNNGAEPLAPSPDIWNQIRGDIESLKSKTTQIEDTLNNKVDRDGSKVLSTNDYTNEDKDKLAGIQHGAEKNVQSDWNQADTTADDYIKHKPENLAQDSNYVHTDNNFTDQEKLKLRDIESRAEVNKIDKVSDHSGRPLTITDKGVKLPDFALRSEITSVYRMKGSLSNLAAIQSVVNKEIGDVYNAEDSGMNYVWNGSIWDALGSSVDLSVYHTKNESDDRYVQKESGKALSSNDYTTNEKNKLAGIEEQAQKNPPIDTTLSETSKNAVENKVITTEMSKKAEKTDVEENSSVISDILNAFSKESDKGTNLKLNSSATKVLGMTIYGNTEQVKTSGYNIFRFGDMNNTLSQGVKSKTDENGYITSTGTATTDWASVTSFDSNSVLMPGTYTLSIEPSAPIRTSINGELVSNNSYKWLGAVDPGQNKVTFTVTEPIKQVRLSIRTVPNQALNIKFRPMLEAGIEAHSYEPYTGGAANLYDCTNGLPVTVGGLTLKQTNGTLRCTGTATQDFVRFQEKIITGLLKDNTAYSVYADNPTADFRFTVRLKRKDNNSYEYYSTINSQTVTFTWNTSVYSEAYIYLVTGEKAFWNGSNSIASRFGLFKGASFDGNNYTHVGMNAPTFGEIKGVNNIHILSQGKNLFDTRFGERVVNGVNIKTYSDGSFELNGTPTTGFSLMSVFDSKSYITSEKYKLKIEHLGGSVEKVWSGAYFIYTIPIQRNTSKQLYQAVLKPEHLNNSSNEFAITVNDTLEEYYVPFIWVPYHIETSEAFWNYKNLRLRITLVKDGENTDFTEFISSSLSSNLPALYKVGNYQDYIIMRDDKWYLVKNTATKTLNGKENWIKTAEPENIFICQNIINATKNYDDAYFSHFNNIKRYPNTDKTGAIRGNNGTNVAFYMNNIPNITSFKNWLNQNNVTVLYPIAQPVTTEITDSTILAELNKLMGMRTYDRVTNVVVTSAGVTPELKIKYVASIKRLLD